MHILYIKFYLKFFGEETLVRQSFYPTLLCLQHSFNKLTAVFELVTKKGAPTLWIKAVQCEEYQSTSIFFFYCKNRSVIQKNDTDTLNEMKA